MQQLPLLLCLRDIRLDYDQSILGLCNSLCLVFCLEKFQHGHHSDWALSSLVHQNLYQVLIKHLLLGLETRFSGYLAKDLAFRQRVSIIRGAQKLQQSDVITRLLQDLLDHWREPLIYTIPPAQQLAHALYQQHRAVNQLREVRSAVKRNRSDALIEHAADSAADLCENKALLGLEWEILQVKSQWVEYGLGDFAQLHLLANCGQCCYNLSRKLEAK